MDKGVQMLIQLLFLFVKHHQAKESHLYLRRVFEKPDVALENHGGRIRHEMSH